MPQNNNNNHNPNINLQLRTLEKTLLVSFFYTASNKKTSVGCAVPSSEVFYYIWYGKRFVFKNQLKQIFILFKKIRAEIGPLWFRLLWFSKFDNLFLINLIIINFILITFFLFFFSHSFYCWVESKWWIIQLIGLLKRLNMPKIIEWSTFSNWINLQIDQNYQIDFFKIDLRSPWLELLI